MTSCTNALNRMSLRWTKWGGNLVIIGRDGRTPFSRSPWRSNSTKCVHISMQYCLYLNV